MVLQNLLDQGEKKQCQKDIEYVIADRILNDFFEICGRDNVKHVDTGNSIMNLFQTYFALKGTFEGRLLENFMKQHNFSYVNSVHNSIYYLLGRSEELQSINTNPLLWPGVNGISISGIDYKLDTNLGIINVKKASELFKKTTSKYIFDKQLMKRCYDRSYDFIRQNRYNYRVILSAMPNFFNGNHYHAYLESDDGILDIAANSFYGSKDDADKILCGDILTKLNYWDIESDYEALEKEIPNLREHYDSKLYTLSLLYDYKNNK